MLVAVRMLEFGISGMPVVEDGRVLGVVSETDILYKERAAPDRAKLADWLAHYPDDPPRAKHEARTATQYQRNVQTALVPAGGVFDVKIDQPGLYQFVSHSFAAVDLGQVGLLNVGGVKGTMSH